MCVLWLFPDRRLALCGLAGRSGCLCVCCGSSLTGDLPCAVWPAGVAACVCGGSSLTSDLPCAVWPAGVAACVYGGSSLTGDLPCAVWPARVATCVRVLWLFPDQRLAECGLARLTNYICVDNLSYCDFCVLLLYL